MFAATLADRIGHFIIGVFAVAGGLFVGWLASALLLWLFGRFLFGRQLAKPLKQIINGTVGLWLAVAVAVLVFGGESGWGFGGTGFGLGGGGSIGLNDVAADTPPSAAPLLEPPPLPTAGQERLRVTLLGGKRVHQAAYYQIEGERVARTLAEVQQAIRARRTTAPLAGLELLIYDNSVARNSSAVRELEAWAGEVGLSVTVVIMPGELP